MVTFTATHSAFDRGAWLPTIPNPAMPKLHSLSHSVLVSFTLSVDSHLSHPGLALGLAHSHTGQQVGGLRRSLVLQLLFSAHSPAR